MIKWLVPRSDLTDEQLRAVELPVNNNKIIVGAPGSGKTLVLVHRAEYLVNDKKISPEKIQIFVYTNMLKNYIKSGIQELGIYENCVTTLDSWCVKYHHKYIKGILPKKDNTVDFPEVRKKVLGSLKLKNAYHFYDVVLVDEGQDIDITGYEILKIISKHTTVCFDRKQKIYSVDTTYNDVKKILQIPNISVNILSAFRCSPFIVDLASEFIEDTDERKIFKNQNKRPDITRETPVLYIATDIDDERENLIKILKSRIHQDDTIGILLPRAKYVCGLATSLVENGIDVEYSENPNKNVDFNSDKPKVMTYHKAKGLTFDTVLLPWLSENCFPHHNNSEIIRILFVGISRAVKWVYLSTRYDSKMPLLSRIYSLKKKGKLTVSEPQNLFSQKETIKNQPDEENELGLL